MPNLRARLALVASFVRPGSRLADIGTDHAYLPVELVKAGVCPRALACDLRRGPLENARIHIEKAGLADTIECRLGSGLSPVSAGEADDIVLAGMGGETIVSILAACPFLRDSSLRLIVQPMTHPEELRRFLWENGFEIDAEAAVIEDEKSYLVLCAHYGGTATAAFAVDCYVGRLAPSSAAFAYQQKRLRAAEQRLAGLLASDAAQSELTLWWEIVSRLKESLAQNAAL